MTRKTLRKSPIFVFEIRKSLLTILGRLETLRASRAQLEVDEHYEASIAAIRKIILGLEYYRPHKAATIKRALKLYLLEGEDALPLKVIEHRLGVPRQTIHRWVRKARLPVREHPVRR